MNEREKEVELFYDNIAKDFDQFEDRLSDKILEHIILDNLPKNKKLRILDVGGGIGRFSKPLLELGHNVVMTDISKEMLEHAKKRLSNFNNISFVKESASNMENQISNSFDVVMMINGVLNYCKDYEKAIKESFRVLKKNGIFMGSVNNRFIYCRSHELKKEKYQLFEKNMKIGSRYIVWGGQKRGHISYEFTLDKLQKSLKRGKFKILKILGPFNLLDKYEIEQIENKKEFIDLQVK